MLTSSLNTILKGEKQNWVYACGLLPLEGQKVIMLKNYKVNSTPRNGCTRLLCACLYWDGSPQG